MKNVLITIFFILSFAPMFAQTVPEKEIDFEGSFIMDDARSASLPIEAYLQDTQVVITFYVDLSDATVTIASEENNQEMEERTISFIDSAPEVFNISGYSKGTYIIGEFYQFNLSSCIRQQNSLTAQFVSFSLANLANIFYPPPIFTIINLCLL